MQDAVWVVEVGRVAGHDRIAVAGGKINIAVGIGGGSIPGLPDRRQIEGSSSVAECIGHIAAQLRERGRVVAHDYATRLRRFLVACAAKRNVNGSVGLEQAGTLDMMLGIELPLRAIGKRG